MAAYTTNLGLSLPVTGTLAGTWGDEINNSITSLLDTAIAGTVTLSADADVTLSTTDGAANQARSAVILWTATNGANTRSVTVPSHTKAYIVINAGTGSVIIKGAATTGVTIATGVKALIAWNGSDFVRISSSAVALADITGLGTGVATALAVNVGSAGAVQLNNGSGAGLTSVNAATLGGATFAAPGAIGGGTAEAGTFTDVGITAGSSGPGKLSKSATTGLQIRGITGSTHDVEIANSSGATAYAVFTGTANSSMFGNLNIAGTRLTGDFTNATLASRLTVQTSTTDGLTAFGIVPNGTGTAATVQTFNASDPTNASRTYMGTTSTLSGIYADKTGTGSYLPLVFYTDGGERARITSTGLNSTNIGATTPGTGAFTTLSSTGVVSSTAETGQFTANAATNADGYSFYSNSAGTGYRLLGIGNSTNFVYIGADNSSGTLTGTAWQGVINSTYPLSIKASGGVSTFNASGLAVTGTLGASGAIQGAGGNAPTLGYHLGTTTSTVTPRITNNSNDDTVIRPGKSGSRILFDNFANSAENLAINDDGVVDLLKGQIKFPATQSASTNPNTLDDYEKGTWTPVAYGTTSSGVGTYTEQSGTYKKIGGLVAIYGSVSWSAHTGTGNLQISGLPFQCGASNRGSVTIESSGLVCTAPLGRVEISSQNVVLVELGTATRVAMDTDVAYLFLNGTYQV